MAVRPNGLPFAVSPRHTISRFRVEALEKFVVRTVYFVETSSPQEAEQQCQTGTAAEDELQVEEGDEEWLETVSVRRETAT